MALALEDRAMKDDIMLGDTPKALKRRRKLTHAKTQGRLWKHATLADVDGLLPLRDIDGMFVFTMVRNPWDRMVSYYHWLRDQRFDHPAVSLAGQVDFKNFAQSDLISASMAANPAHRYVTDVTGTDRCSLYIRLEHFAQDARPLMDHLGFDLALPHQNKSQRSVRYQDYYDDATRKAVAGACADDIAQFGYRFDQ